MEYALLCRRMMFDCPKTLLPESLKKRRGCLSLLVACLVWCPAILGAQSVTLAWKPSLSFVAGYMVYYGTASGAYSTRIDVGTNLTCTIANLQEGWTYYFVGTAYDDLGIESIYSDEISYTVTLRGPPTITVQPTDVTAVAGTTASFSVSAGGPAPLSFQWSNRGTVIAGATDAALTIPNIADADAGNYSVTVTNLSGSATSSVVRLTVVDPPVITSQPASLTNIAGTTATFTVGVSSASTVAYQWLKAGKAIVGATNASLGLPNVSSNSAGNYAVTVTNLAGNATSRVAVLTVICPPAITKQPSSVTNAVGSTATFTVTATGSAPLSYQWFKAGVLLSGATKSTLNLTKVTSSNAGSYTVKVTNSAGAATSSVANLTVTNTTKAGRTRRPISLTLAGNTNHWYELQASTNLIDWNTIWQSPTVTNDSPLQFQDPETELPCRFYRWLEH